VVRDQRRHASPLLQQHCKILQNNNIAKTTKATLRNKVSRPELTDTPVQAGFLFFMTDRHGLHGPASFPLEYKQYYVVGECIAPCGIDDDMIILWTFVHTGETCQQASNVVKLS
jgi:hypothetical protein